MSGLEKFLIFGAVGKEKPDLSWSVEKSTSISCVSQPRTASLEGYWIFTADAVKDIQRLCTQRAGANLWELVSFIAHP